MGEENRSLLEEEIKAEIKRLGSLESGSQEHTTAVDSLTKLYKLKLEEDILTRPLTKPSRILIVKKTKDFIDCCIHCFTCASWLALRSKVGLF